MFITLVTLEDDVEPKREKKSNKKPAPKDGKEGPADIAPKELLKKHFEDELNANFGAKENPANIELLYAILQGDTDLNDDRYIGNSGTFALSNSSVGCSSVFRDGTKDNSTENIDMCLESAALAVAMFGDAEVFVNGSSFRSEEQMAMIFYAGKLTGCNDTNRPDTIELSDEIKEKMDTQWKEMQKKLGIEPKPDAGADAGPKADDKGTEPKPDEEGKDPKADDKGTEPKPDEEGKDPKADDKGTEPKPGEEGKDPKADDKGTEPKPGEEGKDPKTPKEGTDTTPPLLPAPGMPSPGSP